MEFLVEKIGMSRTIDTKSIAVTLLRVIDAKVCEIYENKKALIAYAKGKASNKAIAGQQKKYNLSKEFNRFATLQVGNAEVGDLDKSALENAQRLKVTFKTKGRGFSGAMKRWNFQGGPAAHGSRFHRRLGSIGNREWPGRVQPGKKMAGHYGNETVTAQNEVVSFDKESNILVLKGSVAGFSGAYGKIQIIK
ncbi:50S ribosomal protein L3 [Helicobacter mustelae]|uniref:50S ribosomal protein L3 n=1 Tax=Helicobacter mustelae (strain ATCC 43772 / CCUG 25715 / CIP 103759 / LMG 18044 / NCTC 12198 / R85-136P) TaxID=679897 RepID=D3UII9_HELM1|nr:50S ribosomal protein L3 [Helicobacter mustelae]CBG40312.1 50S ribosomal protein L3 [Helicobacter mustelae 12198]SQH71811.1 50S ribosomal protein L3 [Helicobacter mustelae]STP12940.1 50S ribosomal protein L3 [Helicobacter mustelae]